MTNQEPMSFGADPFEQAFGTQVGPVHLPSLLDANRERALAELGPWVDQLITRFSIDPRVIPPCWRKHNGIVESLFALRDHEGASYAPSASPAAAVDWLRALHDVTSFLTQLSAMTMCSVGEHREPFRHQPSGEG
ncbi:hypothetical protein XE97_24930 [Salmonella enterica subsp. enterica serovar Senftenberg]|nr:hypothetical protein [Salmonella enterica subsp. enterica serovar Senftenberg]